MSEKEENQVENQVTPNKELETPVEEMQIVDEKVEPSDENNVIEVPVEKLENSDKTEILDPKPGTSVEEMQIVDEKLETSNKKVEVLDEKLEIPVEKPENAADKMDIPAEKLESAADKMEIPAEKSESAADKMEISSEKLESAADKMEISSEKPESAADKMEIPAEKEKIPVENTGTKIVFTNLHIPGRKLELLYKEMENAPELKNTKQYFREHIYCQLAERRFPQPLLTLTNRTPYFRGATEAKKRFAQLEAFKQSKTLMISPDKYVMLLSLRDGKEYFIPTPRLYAGLFVQVKDAEGVPEEEKKYIVNRGDITHYERPFGFKKKDLKLDMIVVGSVCVTKEGHRIGDGDGFTDLEYAILSKMEAIQEHTLIVTLVHDCQIRDDIPSELFQPNDIPVDVIVTPTQTIFINPKLPRPSKIFWSLISARKLAAIPVLREIKRHEEKNGNVVNIKEEESDDESITKDKIRVKKMVISMHHRQRYGDSYFDIGFRAKSTQKNKDLKRKSYYKKKKLLKNKENQESIEKKPIEKQVKKTKSTKSAQKRFNALRDHVEFSLRLSNIASSVRVRDLKNALLERGVKPTNITWRGQKGFCYLHFGRLRKNGTVKDQQPFQVNTILENLQQLKIGGTSSNADNGFIVVEPAEPITKIEVTDISAV